MSIKKYSQKQSIRLIKIKNHTLASVSYLLLTCAQVCLVIGASSSAFALNSSGSSITLDESIRGKISPAKKSQLSASRDGQAFFHVDEGETFTKGSLLVSLDCGVLDARLSVLTVELEGAKVKRAAQEKLANTGSVGRLELSLSEISVREAEANLDVVREELKYCSVFAPYDGVLSRRHISDWEYAKKSDVLVDIFDNSELEIEFIVPSVWLRWLQVNDEFKFVTREAVRSLSGKVKKIDTKIDPVSQSVRVWGAIGNKEQQKLKPGMTGEVRFLREAK